MTLGERVRAARKRRDWSQADLAAAVTDAGFKLQRGTLYRMENGERPGGLLVWAVIWRVLGLPLRDLYLGLGLPIEEDGLDGVISELVATSSAMPEETQRLVLAFARHARQIHAESKGGE